MNRFDGNVFVNIGDQCLKSLKLKTYRKLNKIQLFGLTVVCSTDSHCPKLLSTFIFLDFHPTVIVVLYLCQLTEKFVVYIFNYYLLI